MVRLVFISVLVSVVLLQFVVERASSACCGATMFGRQCGDGTRGTPCCGRQKCNIFCCACHGGCRGKKRAFDDMLQQLVDNARERRRLENPANEAEENEDDMQEERDIDDGDDYSACKRQCLQGELISHRQAEQLPDSIVKRGITDDNCKRACTYMKRNADKK